jgi:hypothetical protein
MGIIQKKPMPQSENKGNVRIFFASWLGILTLLLIIVLYIGFKKEKPEMARSYIKENKSGLVTVIGKEGKPLCQFYDSLFHAYSFDCPDTILVVNGKKIKTDTARGLYNKIVGED